MPTTLEMPLMEEMSSADSNHHESNGHGGTAEAAADLIDQGEAVADAPDEPPPEEPPTKPKRGRKKKAKPEAEAEAQNELDQDHPFDTNEPTGEAPADAVPVPIDQPLPPKAAAVEPQPMKIETSQSTRRFQVSQIRNRYVDVCLEIAETEAEIERRKDNLKGLQKLFAKLSLELRSAMNDAEYQPPLPFETKPPASETNSTEPESSRSGGETPAAAGETNDAWRKVSINQLGLSPKLEEKLHDAGAVTIGQLEDLRAEISQGRAKWPKGVGVARITEIEDAVVEWLSKNRDAAVLAEAAPVAGQPPDDNAIPTADQWEAMTDDQRRDYIARRADAINDGTPNCLAQKHADTDRFYEQGFKDFSTEMEIDGVVRKCELRDCIYLPGIELDDWIRGWLAAGTVEDYEPSEAAESAAATANTGISLDDI